MLPVDRPALDGESFSFERSGNDIQRRFPIVKGNGQDIPFLELIVFDALNSVQDSPYPLPGPSGGTSGHGQLHRDLARVGHADPNAQKHQDGKYDKSFLHPPKHRF